MQIKEVEELLDMTSYALRYYEKMGLIHPQRDENGYRNYSNQDILNLKRIRFLRELQIPIEDIQSILNDSHNFQEVLEKHIQSLSSKIHSLEYVQSVCENLKEKDIPLLDAMIDEKIISEENINQKQMVSGLNKIVEYLKPSKTVVIGTRVMPRNFITGVIFMIIASVLTGILFVLGVSREFRYINDVNKVDFMPSFTPSIQSYIIAITVCFIIFFMILYLFTIKQDYIELTDQSISICSRQFQSSTSIFLGMMLRQTKQRNKNYQYSELEKVEIKLVFSTMGGGASGLWRIYVPQFIFHFYDGNIYPIESGVSIGEKTKDAYQILKQKQIDIDTTKDIIGYFEQDEKDGFTYFEDIYHQNGKRVR